MVEYFKNSLDDFLLVVELECLRELVHELPCGVDELGEYRRDLFAVAGQVTASVQCAYFDCLKTIDPTYL